MEARPVCGLTGIAASHDFKRSAHQDCEIQPKDPVGDVPEIVLNAPLDHGRRRGWAAAAMDLGPSGQSWFSPVPESIIPYEPVELSVVGQCMGARADQRHAAIQDI